MSTKLSDYNYELPQENIAIFPPQERGSSRLLVLNRENSEIIHSYYKNLTDFLEPGDLLVLNDTKVVNARLVAENEQGKKVEIFLTESHEKGSGLESLQHLVIFRGKLNSSEVIKFSFIGGFVSAKVQEVNQNGTAILELIQNSEVNNWQDLVDKSGEVPIPPYLKREATTADSERYQTVFAKQAGSVAAPTASLNFTEELKEKLLQKGVIITYLTLHVGLGTFLPIRSDDLKDHEMHQEFFIIPQDTVEQIKENLQKKQRIVALGTTAARALEFSAEKIHNFPAQEISGEANIFIFPGYNFRIISGLLTNFHAPASTVLMLASAFAGKEKLTTAYNQALHKNYMFLSYGDSMLIL